MSRLIPGERFAYVIDQGDDWARTAHGRARPPVLSEHWRLRFRRASGNLVATCCHGDARPRRISDDGRVEWCFIGEVIEWRGPAPYLFVAMTAEDSEELKQEARGLIYWGQVPVHVTIGDTRFATALFPKDGRYLVPVKVAVQRAEAIGEGSVVEVEVRLNASRRE